MDDGRNLVQFPAAASNFYLLQMVEKGAGAQPPLYPRNKEKYFAGDKGTGM
jgi:hypothetical protein